jgi:hypothetical protein
MDICCGKKLVYSQSNLSVSQAQCHECRAVYQKRSGSDRRYKTTDRGENLYCTTCQAEISGAEVAHPIHDGPFALSGSGKVKTEIVPYCPTCEQKPPYHADPIKKA